MLTTSGVRYALKVVPIMGCILNREYLIRGVSYIEIIYWTSPSHKYEDLKIRI